jgi:hypothetical protein
VLSCTCITSKKDMWLYVFKIPAGNQGAISAQERFRMILTPGGHAEPAEVGVLRQHSFPLVLQGFCLVHHLPYFLLFLD